jgi:hypothetical protein
LPFKVAGAEFCALLWTWIPLTTAIPVECSFKVFGNYIKLSEVDYLRLTCGS